MSSRFFACTFFAATLTFVACSEGQPTTTTTTPAATATPSPQPTLGSLADSAVPSTPTPEIESALVDHLANRLGVSRTLIGLAAFERREWPDGCLGLGGAGSVCSQAFVAGWLATLRGPDGAEYRYRGAGTRFVPE